MSSAVKGVPGRDAELAREALVAVREALESAQVGGLISLSVAGQKTPVEVPEEAMDLFVSVLANMAAGQSVSLIPHHAELTSQQAAEILNVSRPFLVQLLNTGEIDYRKVGTHRRIRADSLMEFKARNDAKARAALDELIALDQEIGSELER